MKRFELVQNKRGDRFRVRRFGVVSSHAGWVEGVFLSDEDGSGDVFVPCAVFAAEFSAVVKESA